MLKQLEKVHAWFTGERALPEENRNLTEQAVALFLSADEPNYVYGWYDKVCLDAWVLLGEAVAADEPEALQLAAYIEMGMWIRAKYELRRLPITLRALYTKTEDPEILEILAHYSCYRDKFKNERQKIRVEAGVRKLQEKDLPADQGAHDLTFYDEDDK